MRDNNHRRSDRSLSIFVATTLAFFVGSVRCSVSKTAAQTPSAKQLTRNAMFHSLSGYEWCADPTDQPSNHIKLFSNGHHETYQWNDAALPASSGLWNFHPYSDTDGVLYLTSEEWQDTRAAETRSVIFRFLSADELKIVGGFTAFDSLRLQRCKAIPSLSTSSVDSLPTVALPPPATSLAGSEWNLDTEFPHGTVPSKIQFDDFGGVVVTLPPGECNSGTYGWPVEQSPASCRKRAAFNAYDFTTVGRLLIHHAEPYRRSTDNSSERTLWLDFARVEVLVTYQPSLWKRPQTFHIELWGPPDGLHLKGTLVLSAISASNGRSTETVLKTEDFDTVVGPARVAAKDIVVDTLPTSPPLSPYTLMFTLRTAERSESRFFTLVPR